MFDLRCCKIILISDTRLSECWGKFPRVIFKTWTVTSLTFGARCDGPKTQRFLDAWAGIFTKTDRRVPSTWGIVPAWVVWLCVWAMIMWLYHWQCLERSQTHSPPCNNIIMTIPAATPQHLISSTFGISGPTFRLLVQKAWEAPARIGRYVLWSRFCLLQTKGWSMVGTWEVLEVEFSDVFWILHGN